MRCFSFVNRSSRILKAASKRKGSYTALPASMAPPWVRWTSPRSSSRTRSRRTLAGDISRSTVNSSTEVLPWCRSNCRISLARLSILEDTETWLTAISSGAEKELLFRNTLYSPIRYLIQCLTQPTYIFLENDKARKFIVSNRAQFHGIVAESDRAVRFRSQGAVEFRCTRAQRNSMDILLANAPTRHDMDSSLRGVDQ